MIQSIKSGGGRPDGSGGFPSRGGPHGGFTRPPLSGPPMLPRGPPMPRGVGGGPPPPNGWRGAPPMRGGPRPMMGPPRGMRPPLMRPQGDS